MKHITEEMIRAAIREGVAPEDARRGYAVCQSDYGGGAEHIERLDCMMAFDSDDEAAEEAERDGFQIIHDLEFDPENQACYIDTPENRRILEPYVTGRKSNGKIR